MNQAAQLSQWSANSETATLCRNGVQVSPAMLDTFQRALNSTEPCNVEAELIEYRGQRVAAFQGDDDLLLCLPQAYELFLKRLVSGLHTVYTKLKRLDIAPTVCNVEQVRALRSIGAIQPGVNRCKLISCADFDLLYEDCASSSSRPGRPPKRNNSCGDVVYRTEFNLIDSSRAHSANSKLIGNKRCRLSNDFYQPPSAFEQDGEKMKSDASGASEEQNSPGVGNVVNNGSSDGGLSVFGNFLNANGFGQHFFPFFPSAAQQLLFNQLLTTFSQKSNQLPSSWSAAVTGSSNSNDHEASACNLSSINHGSFHPSASNEELPYTKNQSFSDNNKEIKKRPAGLSDSVFDTGSAFSIEQLLISMAGIVELALVAVRRQDEKFSKDKEEVLAAFQEEKRKRTQLELSLREKEALQKNYAMRIRNLKAIISDMKSSQSKTPNADEQSTEEDEEEWESDRLSSIGTAQEISESNELLDDM